MKEITCEKCGKQFEADDASAETLCPDCRAPEPKKKFTAEYVKEFIIPCLIVVFLVGFVIYTNFIAPNLSGNDVSLSPDSITVAKCDGSLLEITDKAKVGEIYSLISDLIGEPDGTTEGKTEWDFKLTLKNGDAVMAYYCIWDVGYYSKGYDDEENEYLKSNNLAALYEYINELF